MTDHRHLADDELVLVAEARIHVAHDVVAHDSGRQPAAEVHLASCAACRARLADLTALDAALRTAHTGDDWTAEARQARRRARLQQLMTESPVTAPWSIRLREARMGATLAALVFAALGLVGARLGPRPTRTPERAIARVAPTGALPIRLITPGATVALPADVLCRQVPLTPSPISEAVRADVLRAYGMEQLADHEYELDYLITPDLGGAPDPRNLWPEPYHSPIWNARVKDELESLLPRLVCEGKIDLQTAQRDIAVDWIAAYKKYFKTDRPLRQS